jgi:hypothetical protein
MIRCAYCHASEGDLARCAGCGTQVHVECRATHGRCPTLGCHGPCKRLDRPLTRLGLALLRWALR